MLYGVALFDRISAQEASDSGSGLKSSELAGRFTKPWYLAPET